MKEQQMSNESTDNILQQMRASYGGFMDSVPMVELDPNRVPRTLVPYMPYAALWGVADDLEREQRVENAPNEAKQDLVKTVQSIDGLLDDWLAGDEANSDAPSVEYIAFSAMKEMQRNWIGRSEGARIHFDVDGSDEKIEVFTTRPDTLFGVSFMVLSPEHPLSLQLTTEDQQKAVQEYVDEAAKKTERDRMSDVKKVTGCFTGAYAIHPFSGEKLPIWVADYVLFGYGTGAIMAVPSGDQRDWNFATTFDLPIPNVIEGADISEAADESKDGRLVNSDFLNGLQVSDAISEMIRRLEEKGIGEGKVQFRLRDAVFSRQRYWGEPIPVYFENGIPRIMDESELPLELPEVDKYLPTEEGEPPLARAEDWHTQDGHAIEANTMPGWAGSSWYLFRYMDPQNEKEPFSKEAVDYWKNVDFYVGGAEHATGHLLYARFWTKFLYDLGLLPKDEPFQKMMNQGMITYYSAFLTANKKEKVVRSSTDEAGMGEGYRNWLIPVALIDEHIDATSKQHYGIEISKLQEAIPEYKDYNFFDGEKKLGDSEEINVSVAMDKMSKSKFNVVNPDELIEYFGADTLRCYEMFLGPVEQHKPWDQKGIEGVSRFLKRFWGLFHDGDEFKMDDSAASDEAKKALNKFLKKVSEDIERLSFNTVVSECMILSNTLNELKCRSREILEPFVIALSPYAPHIADELWEKLGHEDSVCKADFPGIDETYLVESSVKYPISFNGKVRFTLEVPVDMSKEDLEKEVLANENSAKWLEGKEPRKVIIVPNKIVNIVV